MIKSANHNTSLTGTPNLLRELYAIFLLYLKVFSAVAVAGAIFLFFYAGVKTGNITVEAIIFTGIGALVLFQIIYRGRRRIMSQRLSAYKRDTTMHEMTHTKIKTRKSRKKVH